MCEYVQSQTKKKLIPWQGFCHVHTRLSPQLLERAKAKYPDAKVIIHPETPERVTKLADHICGTGGMAVYIANHPEVKTFLIGTEEGMTERLRRDFPDREIHSLMGTCINMKQITLENILSSLKEEKYEINVSPKIFDAAQNPPIFGIDGMPSMDTINGGLGLASSAFNIYNGIKGMNQREEYYADQHKLTTQQIANNDATMEKSRLSDKAFADATRAVMGSSAGSSTAPAQSASAPAQTTNPYSTTQVAYATPTQQTTTKKKKKDQTGLGFSQIA